MSTHRLAAAAAALAFTAAAGGPAYAETSPVDAVEPAPTATATDTPTADPTPTSSTQDPSPSQTPSQSSTDSATTTPTGSPSTATSTDKPAPTPGAYPLRVVVTASLDQHISKVGQTITWSVSVTNDSPNAVEAVTVEITPPGAELTTDLVVSPDGVGTSEGGLWTIGTLAPGQSVTARASAKAATLTAATGYILAASAKAQGLTRPETKKIGEGSADSDGFDAAVVLPAPPVLQVDVVSAGTIVSKAGDEVTWTVNLTNKGLGTASNVKVTFSGQNGVDESTITASSLGKGSYDPASRTWSIPALAATDGIIKATVTAKIANGVNFSAIPTLSARAVATEVSPNMSSCEVNTSLDADTDACDHDGTAVNTSKLAVDVALDKGQLLYGTGDVATWSVTVKNTDKTSVASNVVVTDVPGVHLSPDTLIWGSASQGSTDKAQWKVGDLAPGASATIKVSIELAPDTTPTAKPVNGAYATSATQSKAQTCAAETGLDADTDRCDTDEIILSVKPLPTLRVDLTPKPGSVLSSRQDRVTWAVTATNTGAAPAEQVKLTARPGPQADATSLKWNAASKKTVAATKNVLTIPALGAGEKVSAELSMTPTESANLAKGVSTSVLAAATGLPATSTCVANGEVDDTDRCDVSTITTGDVKLKIDQRAIRPQRPPAAGSTVTWVITVKNSGSTPAKNALVSTTSTVGVAKGSLAFVGKPPTGTFDVKAGTWKIPVLAAGQSLTASLRGTIDAGTKYAPNIIAVTDIANPVAPLPSPGKCTPNSTIEADDDQCDVDALAYKIATSTTTTPGGTYQDPAGASTVAGKGVAGKGVEGKGMPVRIAAGTPAPILANPLARAAGVVMACLSLATAVLALRRRMPLS